MSEVAVFLESYKFVTTGLSLAGFCIAGFTLYLRSKHLEKLAAINKSNAELAAQLVNGTLVSLKLDTENLTKQQRFELAKMELSRLSRRELYRALGTALFGVILAAVSLVAIAERPREPDSDALMKDVRSGTPAQRQAALQGLKRLKSRPGQVERLIGAEMLAANGQELCNLMLAASRLQSNSTLDVSLRSVSESTEYQLKGPVCTYISAPDFSNVIVSQVAFVHPSFDSVNFTRARWNGVVVRGDQDYSGQEKVTCSVEDTAFIGAVLESSSFSGCALTRVDFNSATLGHVSFHRSLLDRVDFKFSKLVDVRFLGATLKHVDLRGFSGSIKFALKSIGEHVRIDFESAKRVGAWPKDFSEFECISSSQANQCWDLVSDDISECRVLSRSRTYVVTAEDKLSECLDWIRSARGK